MKLSNQVALWLLIIFISIENITSTYFTRNNLSFIYFSSVLYFISGVAIAVIPLFRFSFQEIPHHSNLFSEQKYFSIIAFSITVIYTLFRLPAIFQLFPVDYLRADMIPQIIVECNRFLAGEWVYDPTRMVKDLGIPTYLPMMWMPYVPSLQAGFDVRWTTVIFYLTACGIIIWSFAKIPALRPVQLILITGLVLNIIFIQTSYNDVFFAWTEEGIVVFYYVVLGIGLIRRNSLLIIIGITCCLLSRYSLFFWIPAYFLFEFLRGEKKKAIIEAAGVVMLTLIIFVIPFFMHDPMYFLSLPAKYHLVTPIAWKEYPQNIYRSMGLAKFFSFEQINLLHIISLAVSVIVPFLFYMLIFVFRKNKNINLQLAGICGLKMTLAFFYAFVEIPYYYLFFVNTIFSFVVLIGFFSIVKNEIKKSAIAAD